MHKEKIKRIQTMIQELRAVEAHIEKEIMACQVRLDEHRKRRAILQDLLEEEIDVTPINNECISIGQTIIGIDD